MVSKNAIKKLLALSLAANISIGGIAGTGNDSFSISAGAETIGESDVTIGYSGECGNTEEDEVYWAFDAGNGTLTISGNGAMISGVVNDIPWQGVKNKIKKVVIEEGVTDVGDYAFIDCRALQTVVLSDTVETIGGAAFDTCMNLTEINIPASVKAIYGCAFSSCYSLDLTIPATVTTIGDGAFWLGIKSVTLEEGNPVFIIEDGVIYNKNKTRLVYFPCDKSVTDYVLPETITEIPAYSFSGNDKIWLFEIPETVTSIGRYAFYSCDILANVIMPESVRSIGYDAFGNGALCIRYKGSKEDFNKIGWTPPGDLSIVYNHSGHSSYVFDKKEATCTEDGYEEYLCTICSHKEKKIIPAVGHSVDFNVWLSDADEHWHPCIVCDEKTDVDAHTFSDWKITTESTCTKEGTKERYCEICDVKETKAVPVVGHSVDLETWHYDDTEHWHECVNCSGKSGKEEHDFVETDVTKATCTAEGKVAYECECGQKKTEVLEKLPHSYSEKWSSDDTYHWHECACGDKSDNEKHSFEEVSRVEPTCTAEGKVEYECECGQKKTEVLEKLPHNYSEEWSNNKTNHWYECECGYKNDESVHTAGNWIIDKEATVTEAGSKHKECTVCKYIMVEEEIEKLVNVIPEVTVTADDGRVTLTWNKILGAKKYAVYLYTNKYTAVSKDVTGTGCTIKGLTNGKAYYFLVQSYIDNKWSSADRKYLVKAVPIAPPTPIVKAEDKKLTLTWEAVPGATKYSVYSYADGKYIKIDTSVTETSYVVENLVNGKSYSFLVQAFVNGKWTKARTSYVVSGTPVTPVVEPPAPTIEAGNGQLTLTWDVIPGASKYAIYKYENGKYTAITRKYSRTTATIKDLTNGKKYSFLVQAYVDGRWSKASTKYLVSGTPVEPTVEIPVPSVQAGNGQITLKWKAIPGASKYAIYKYENGKYVAITKKHSGTTATIKNLTNDKQYYFLVQAYVDGRWSKASTKYLVSATPSATVPLPDVTVGNGKLTLNWYSVPGATKYAIYKYEDGKYTAITRKYSKTTATIKNLENGKEYNFLVQAYVNGKWTSANKKYLVKGTPVKE